MSKGKFAIEYGDKCPACHAEGTIETKNGAVTCSLCLGKGYVVMPEHKTIFHIDAFNDAVDECRDIYIDRHRQYGDFREQDRFYHTMGFGLKAYRVFNDLKNGKTEIMRDTLIDIAVYAIMLLARETDAEK